MNMMYSVLLFSSIFYIRQAEGRQKVISTTFSKLFLDVTYPKLGQITFGDYPVLQTGARWSVGAQ